MTKLEILRGYTARRVRDSWAAMGSQLATPGTTIYIKDLLYRVTDPASAFTGLSYTAPKNSQQHYLDL